MADSSRSTDVKVGIFVVGALVTLTVGGLWVAGSSFMRTNMSRYRIMMKSAGGITTGDRVRLAGVEVGSIDALELRHGEEWPVVATVAIGSGITLYQDGSAQLASSGVLGATYMEINPGSIDAPVLPPGGEIYALSGFSLDDALARVDDLAREGLRLLSTTTDVLDRVSARIEPLLGRMEALLSDENSRRIHDILAGLQETLEETRPRIGSLLDRVDAIAASAETGTENLPVLIEQLNTVISDLRTALGSDGERLAGMMDAAAGSLDGAEVLMNTLASNRGEIESALRDMADAASNLKQLSQTLEERPWSLIRITPQPDRRPGDGVGGSDK